MHGKGHAMKPEDYQLDILVQGYPGKSVCHGGLGWSTIVLLRGGGHNSVDRLIGKEF